ncbi:MAG: hypothetical protein IPJ68_01050 [Candidatus Moraniibacteriota bacterium]|nr:MAG: hypothetical protein IPJ68_01050 [Candidatus Moranbacteria bacterium]
MKKQMKVAALVIAIGFGGIAQAAESGLNGYIGGFANGSGSVGFSGQFQGAAGTNSWIGQTGVNVSGSIDGSGFGRGVDLFGTSQAASIAQINRGGAFTSASSRTSSSVTVEGPGSGNTNSNSATGGNAQFRW